MKLADYLHRIVFQWITPKVVTLLFIGSCAVSQAQTITWQEDFESPVAQDNWYADNGVWEFGMPTSGPAEAHGGTICVAVGLTETPAAGLDSRLISPRITVPAGNLNPRLRFWHWFEIQSDYSNAYVEIREGAGAWTVISPNYVGTSNGKWTRAYLDLNGYAGKSVQFAFHYASGRNLTPGWFIDDVLIQTDGYAPTISSAPISQTVILGKLVDFTVTADGSAPLSYHWYLNGVSLTNDGRISGVDTRALSISSALGPDAGEYTVVVSNSVSSVTSAPPATLTVLLPAVITAQPQSQSVLRGNTALLNVEAEGNLPIHYQWFFNDQNLPWATNSSLVFSSVQLTNAGTYSVVVSNIAGEMRSSNAVLNVLLVPMPFTSQDVGEPGAAGNASYENGVFMVTGSGEDMEGTADDFQFVHQPLLGDGQIIVRLVSLQSGDQAAEAGVMLRESLASGSRHVLLAANTRMQTAFRRRLLSDDYSVENLHHGTNNYSWLRLMRMGDTFVGHVSTNGLDWEYAWFTTLNMPSQAEVGLAVTAHNHGALATAEFDNVTVGALTPLSGTWSLSGPKALLGGEPFGVTPLQVLGGFKMLLGGLVGDQIRVESSESLPGSKWTDLGTFTNTIGVTPFLDPQALTNAHQFYRIEKVGP